MSDYRDDDLEPALRAMLGDHRLDLRPRADALDTVLAGVGRARRRRTTGYAAVTTLLVAGVIGGIALTAGDEPQSFQPVQTTRPTVTPTATPSAAPTVPTTTVTATTTPVAPMTPTGPELQMLTPNGIGDIQLGMSLADAYGTGTIRMLGLDGTLTDWDGSGAERVCTPAGTARRTTPDGATVWLNDAQGVVEIALWTSSNPEVQTIEGLHISDPFDRVPELYPEARFVSVEEAEHANFYFVDDWGGTGNLLKIRDGSLNTIDGISVMLGESPGGCYE